MTSNKWKEWEGPNTPVTAIQAMQEKLINYLRIAEILVGMHQSFLMLTQLVKLDLICLYS